MIIRPSLSWRNKLLLRSRYHTLHEELNQKHNRDSVDGSKVNSLDKIGTTEARPSHTVDGPLEFGSYQE
jgi:hypothetical protein